ncbi:hypothetical protein HPB47_026770 [Ixodes persulcatus]|uniref:Uncharacterized protein n=1 Tax=Ixodes persulcatus TaxID=34615 RepID=A0AC60PZP8_IXOPE|nr:hypothetical protein HPB47_026770 [Ixodes persulcatus]
MRRRVAQPLANGAAAATRPRNASSRIVAPVAPPAPENSGDDSDPSIRPRTPHPPPVVYDYDVSSNAGVSDSQGLGIPSNAAGAAAFDGMPKLGCLQQPNFWHFIERGRLSPTAKPGWSLPFHVLLIRGRTGGVGNVNSSHCIPSLGCRFASSDMVGDLSHEFPATARPRRRRLRRGPSPREWNDGLAPHLEKNHWHEAAGQPEVVPELTEVAVCSQRYLGHPASPQVVSGPERGLPSPQERTEWPWIPYVVQGPCAPRRSAPCGNSQASRVLLNAAATPDSQTSDASSNAAATLEFRSTDVDDLSDDSDRLFIAEESDVTPG